MQIKEIIEKGIEGGYSWKQFNVSGWIELEKKPFLEAVLLDPKFWEAVGKVEGWGELCEDCNKKWISTEYYGNEAHFWGCKNCKSTNKYEAWKEKQNGLIPHLQEGGTIESYIKTL